MSSATRRRAGLGEAGITVLVGLFLTLQPVSTDLYLASLPGLAARFDASAATVQLTLSLFMGGFGAMQLVAGPMTDRYGRRPLLIGALSSALRLVGVTAEVIKIITGVLLIGSVVAGSLITWIQNRRVKPAPATSGG